MPGLVAVADNDRRSPPGSFPARRLALFGQSGQAADRILSVGFGETWDRASAPLEFALWPASSNSDPMMQPITLPSMSRRFERTGRLLRVGNDGDCLGRAYERASRVGHGKSTSGVLEEFHRLAKSFWYQE